MKIITIIFAFLLSINAIGQDKYMMGMNNAFGQWGEGNFDTAVGLFERIAQAENDKWQPYYYAANVLITQSFSMNDMAAQFLLLEKAKSHIKKAHKISKDNSEIYTLEGLLYTGYVAADPGTFAMQYSGKIVSLHTKAIELNPSNPRALTNKIEYEMGTARFFGQDLAPFCDKLEATIDKYDEEEETDTFDPRYGKERILDIIENCGKE